MEAIEVIRSKNCHQFGIELPNVPRELMHAIPESGRRPDVCRIKVKHQWTVRNADGLQLHVSSAYVCDGTRHLRGGAHCADLRSSISSSDVLAMISMTLPSGSST